MLHVNLGKAGHGVRTGAGAVPAPREEMSSKDAFDLQMEFCARAASGGFDGVSMGHHYLSGPFAQFFQPIPLAGHILAKFPDLYVATTIFLLPYHSPVEVAEQVATIDAMAPGRLILGVGQGYRADEAEGAGIEPGSRRGRMAESIEAMRLLWQDGSATFEGRHFSFHDADIGPRPADPHGPPILIGADTAETVGSACPGSVATTGSPVRATPSRSSARCSPSTGGPSRRPVASSGASP